ncbi:MAG: AraC family transcriptional regulator [Chloroflexota bacterium]
MANTPFNFEGRPSDSSLVESVWRTQMEQAGSFISVAAVHCGIVVTNYQDKITITVRGPETKATPAAFPAGVDFFGIVFNLGTFMPHLPAKLLMNRNDLNLPEANNKSFWLHGSAWEFPTFENVDTFVGRLMHEGLLVHEPVVDAVVQGQPHDLSLRALQYRFLHATGLTQATVHQIERAKQAAALLEQGCSILDTVYEAGYFDQAHLTRSLKRYMGQTPRQITLAEQQLSYRTKAVLSATNP